MRGIDAVIYTRYILSILQQDPSDLESWEAEFFPASGSKAHNPASSSAPNNTPHVSPTPAGQQKLGKSRSSRAEKKQSHFNTEQMKKSAAIECLLSVTEEVGTFTSTFLTLLHYNVTVLEPLSISYCRL